MSPRDAFGRPQQVLLLGGHSDIGLAIVRRMIDDGARRVILAGRDPEREPRPELDAELDRRYFDAVDTSSHAKFFEAVFEDHPGIDLAIVAFGVLRDQPEVELDPAVAVEMAEVNFVGAASAVLHTAGYFRRRGGGDIVLLSSVAGETPRRSNFAYGASKSGIDFLTRGLASSLEGTDVHVMVVRPGFVRTAMTRGLEARPFAVSPETVARAVTDGLARRDRVVWVPSILRWVMAALRLLPSRLVNRLERS